MKKYIVASMIALIFVSGTAFAKEKEKDPFTIIWNAINHLQQQIDDIQLLPGEKGEKGDKGDTGLSGTGESQIITGDIVYFDGDYSEANGGTFIIDRGDQVSASVSCPDGKALLGGGGYVHGFAGQTSWVNQNPNVLMQESYPSDSNTWTVSGVSFGGFGAPATSHGMSAQAYAICSL